MSKYILWESITEGFDVTATVEDDPYDRPEDLEDPEIFGAFDNSNKRYRTFGEEWNYVNVRVAASIAGIELGGSSVGGVESDAGKYLRELADEEKDEAIIRAKKHVKLIKDTLHQRQ